MKRKSISKRLLSILLCLCMVLGLLPVGALSAHAASNVDGGLEGQEADVFTALGFDTSVEPEGYNAQSVDNPYGKDRLPGDQTFEMVIASSGGVNKAGHDNNGLSVSNVASSGFSGSMPLTIFTSAAGDFDGDGLEGEVVYAGIDRYNTGASSANLSMYLYDGKSGNFSNEKYAGRILTPLNMHESSWANPSYDSNIYDGMTYDYQVQNLLQTAAGDFDGDGFDEIAVFICESGNIRVDIYKWMIDSTSKADDWRNLDHWSVVWSHVLSNSSDMDVNLVSLLATDVNRDGIDDLGISWSCVHIPHYDRNATSRITGGGAVMLWGDREKMLQSRTELDLMPTQLGEMTRISLTSGDLNLDGYDELVITGQPLNNFYQNSIRSVIVYTYDGTGGFASLYNGNFKTVDGYYETNEEGTRTWTSQNGFDAEYHSSPYMRTNAAVLKLKGYDYGFLYLDSYLLEYVEGSLTLKMSLDDASYDGMNTLGTTWLSSDRYTEYGAVAADINGDGYDQLYVSYYSDESCMIERYDHVNYEQLHSGGFGGLQGKGDETLSVACKQDSVNLAGRITSQGMLDSSGEHIIGADYTRADNACCFSITPADTDMDTTLIEYTGVHYLSYSDPKVLSVIAAAPYFEDVDKICDYDYAWQNTTSWGTTSGAGHSDLVSVDLEAGIFYASEKVVVAFMTSLETSVNFTMEWEKETSKTTEYTLTFETSQDEDAVAFYSIPTENYVYAVYTPDGKGGYNPPEEKTVSRTFQPVYQVLNLDYYETIRLKHEKSLPQIRGTVLTSTPGDPASYPSSSSGYDVIAQWNRDAAGVSFGNGAISQEITITEEQSESYNLGCALDFQIGFGGHTETLTGLSGFEAQGGFQFSLNPGGGWTDLSLSGTTISGTVTNMPLEFQDYGYYYNWKLFSYAYEFNGDRIPVVSYIVNDVSQPPLLPGDFQQDVERTTSNKNVLTWTYDEDYSKFIIYKYFDFPIGGGLQEVASYQMGEAPFVLKYDEEGMPYKEFYFEDTNLAPYSEYQYAIQVERISEIPPLSAPSALLTARTRAAEGNPNTKMVESDGENNADLLVYPDRNGYLTADVRGPYGEAGYDYYSTIQYQWQKKVDGAWTDMVNETGKTIAFASAGMDIVGQYRCRINVLTKANNTAISAYTDVVEVRHAFRSSVIEEVYIRETKGGTEFYAKVGNAHADSGAVPSGKVQFALTHIQSGKISYHTGELDSTGAYQFIKSGSYPAGTYEVAVTYSSSSIFKSSYGECVFLSQVDEGYSLDMPESVNYGESAKISFNHITTINGFAVKNPVYVSNFGTPSGDPTSVLIDHMTMNLPGWHSAPYIEPGDPVVKYQQYAVKTDVAGLDPGTYFDAVFYSPIDGIFEGKTYETGTMCFRVSGKEIFDKTYIQGDSVGKTYYLLEGTPAGSYTICMEAPNGMVYKKNIKVEQRYVQLQLPTVVKKQDSGAAMGDLTYGQLSVVSGSWAACDSDNNGNITGNIAASSVNPSYVNTAGTVYSKSSPLATCGYYTVGAEDTLDNYRVTYRAGSMSVIGGNRPVTFGVRPFEGKDVGTLYLVAPDYAYTREQKGITMSQAVGSRVVFTAVPDEGYQIYDWYVDGVAQGITDSSFACEVQNQDSTVEVQFVFRPDTLVFGIVGEAQSGTLTCSDTGLVSGSIVIPNTYLTYTAQAREGYHFKEWRYTEQGRGTAYYNEDNGTMTSTFELLMPAVSCSLYAVFEADGCALTYTDRNDLDGLTAWYWGSPTGDATAALEKITVPSGGTVPCGTEVVIQPKTGYRLDEEYNFVSIGCQGVANYTDETYTVKVTEDTYITGYTKQSSFAVTVSTGIAYQYAFCQDAEITLTVDGDNYVYPCTSEMCTQMLADIPGGSKVMVSIVYPDYYVFEGWSVNGKLHSGSTYTLTALGENVELIPQLKEKPVYKVTLADITGKGTYAVSFPEGAGQSGNVVTCHENDPLTVQVIPETGYTVTYWNVKADSNDNSWETKASSLRYQFPKLTADYTFTPVFAATTYHSVTWPTVRYYGVTLMPEAGYLATVASGKEFRFTLSGGDGEYSYVLVNGLGFQDITAAEEGYPHVYEDKNGTRVYTIRNITDNQVITVSDEYIANTLTATTDRPSAHLGQTIYVTTDYSGTKPTHYEVNDPAVVNNGDGTFVVAIDRKGVTHTTYSFTIQSYYGSTLLAETEVNIPISSGYVSGITIHSYDLDYSEDGIYEVTPADAYTIFGDLKEYRFDAWFYISDNNGYTSSPEVIWSVWGAQTRGTTVSPEGTLTVSAKERGVDDQIKLIATYQYPDGSTHSEEMIIKLNSTAYVNTKVSDWRGGTVSEGGLVADGETFTVTATPNENYFISNWYINGVKVSGEISNVLTIAAEEWCRYEVQVEFDHICVDTSGTFYCDICNERDSAVLVTEENYQQLGLEEADIGSYAISNGSQMFWFAELVNSGNTGISGVLLADIDLTGNFWTPMGHWDETVSPNINQPFTGTFDGRGHVIKNLSIFVTDGREIGFFGRAQGATLKNFGVIDAIIHSNPEHDAGYRAGIIGGELHNCVLQNLFSAGELMIYTNHDQRGGIAGECADSILTNCYTTLGGLADSLGAAPKSVTNCYYIMSDDYAFSIGENKDAEHLTSGDMTWSLNDQSSEGIWKQTIGVDAYPSFTGETVYYYNTCKGSGFTNDLAEVYSHSFDGDGFCTNLLEDGQICGACEHAVLNAEGVYEISNAGQLFWFSKLVSGDLPYGTAQNSAASGALMQNIQIGERVWIPIGTNSSPFTGSFNGNGYTVDLGTQSATSSYFALFGRTQDANVAQLTVTGSILVDANVEYVGGIAGFGYGGMVTNCISYVDITLTENAAGSKKIAGIVGGSYTGITISGCANYGTILADGANECVAGITGYANEYVTIFNCANYGDVTGNGVNYVAGILGYINNSGFYGLYNCLNTGDITCDREHCGDMIGWARDYADDTIVNNYYTGEKAFGVDSQSQKTLQARKVDSDQLASGKITWELNGEQAEGVWKQTLPAATLPSFTGEVVYFFADCANNSGYTNDVDAVWEHVWTEANCTDPKICQVCGIVGGDALNHSYSEGTITAEPTCGSQGVKTFTCDRCSDTHTEIVPATGLHADKDKNSSCDVCGYLMQSAVQKMASISFQGDIAINYYLLLSDEVLADKTAYMQFTMADGEIIKIPASQGVKRYRNGVLYYTFTCSVNAKEMADTIRSRFFYDGGSTPEYTYSVQTYAKNMLAKSDDELLKSLVTAMLHYGAAAQTYFGYNTSNLANAGLPEADYTGMAITGFSKPVSNGTALVKVYSATVLMEAETTLRFYLKADSSVESFVVSCKGKKLQVKYSGDLCYVDVQGIVAKDLDAYVTITIYDGVESANVTYNPMTYCSSVVNNTSGAFRQEMKELAYALYRYNQAAKVYLQSHE